MTIIWLRQSTAVSVVVGPFINDTDGKTPETGLTISQADCQLSKNGGAFAQKNSATSASHMAGGHFSVPFSTTDTNTLGVMRLYVNESGALPVWQDFMIVPANVYDSLVGGSDTLNADVTQWSGTNVAAPATAGYPVVTHKVGTGTGELNVADGKVELVDNAINQNSVATNAIDAAALDSSAITEIQSGLATTAALATIDDFLDTEIAAILAAVDTEVAAIKAKTDLLPADPAADGDAMALTSAAVDAILDEVVEGSTTLRQALRLMLASLVGKANGGGTNTVYFRDLADSKNRLVMTVDADGNRSAVTRDAT